MENTNIPKIIILALISPIIILFLLFAFGLSRVDAQSLTFTRPRLIRISSNYDPLNESALKVACADTLTCGSLTGNTGEHFTHIIYRINQNDQDVSISTLPQGTYKISLGFTIRTSAYQDASSIINGDFNLRIFTTNGSSYQNATCDTTPKFTADNYPDSSNRIEITYTCDEIKNTRNDITFFGLTLYTDQWNTYTFISSNLKFIDNTDPNQSVIDNQNQNTQDIINNQNQNTQDIIDNNNSNTDKITDAIEESNKQQQETNDFLKDDTNPDLNAFNNYAGWLPPGPLDSILNLPLSLLNNLTNLFSGGSCSGITLPIPYLNKNFYLPCLSSIYSQINGLNIAINTLFLPIVGYLLFKYLSSLYVWVENTLMLKDSNYMAKWGGV